MNKLKNVIWFAGVIIFSVLVVHLVMFFVQPVQVNGESMEPTLTDGEYLMASTAFKSKAGRGDLIIAWVKQTSDMPEDKIIDGKLCIIKRIIGIPGDEVVINNNTVYVNGEKVDEPYIKEPMNMKNSYYQLKEDEWFVMGDNRNNSLDSRAFGPIHTDEITSLIID